MTMPTATLDNTPTGRRRIRTLASFVAARADGELDHGGSTQMS